MNPLWMILNDHLTRYPRMQVQDLYKLLHQAAMGSEHVFSDESEVRKWLEDELDSMGDGPEEPLLDTISQDGQISRLHLRPCLRVGIDPQVILTTFLHTAEEWRGSPHTLKGFGQAAAQQAEAEQWQIKRLEIEAFFATMEEKGFPAMHHSVIYRVSYRPAYRVVKTEIWRQYESLHLTP
jgi:hypothetical protein